MECENLQNIFRSMLNSKFCEGSPPVLQINDIRYEIFEMVRFVLFGFFLKTALGLLPLSSSTALTSSTSCSCSSLSSSSLSLKTLIIPTSGDAIPVQRLSRGASRPSQRHPRAHGCRKLLPGHLQLFKVSSSSSSPPHPFHPQLDGLLHFCEVRCASLIDLDTIVSYYIHAKVGLVFILHQILREF